MSLVRDRIIQIISVNEQSQQLNYDILYGLSQNGNVYTLRWNKNKLRSEWILEIGSPNNR